MDLKSARPQMSEQLELPLKVRVENPKPQPSEEARTAIHGNERSGTSGLMEEVVNISNMKAALKRVRENKGSPGIDGMTTDELPEFLREHWDRIREDLLAERYQPQAVRSLLIPKKGGGHRELGIPCVLDRLIQQGILQVLQTRFDQTFSEHSYGFRPNRNAHGAIRAATRHIEAGRNWVVDVDIEKFFDRVQHDVLMAKLAKRIEDKRLLRLIRRYLQAGIMKCGITRERHEGTPQGGPLSPLLANVMLDEVDRELEKRGHAFARYADDCNVYVQSKRAGERVMDLLERLYGRLRLNINKSKSAVALATTRKFLGFRPVRRNQRVTWLVAEDALEALKEKIRTITSRTGGRSIGQVAQELRYYLNGWKQYFRIVTSRWELVNIDKWIRRRLRMIHLKQWKNGIRAYKALSALGAWPRKAACAAANLSRWWWTSKMDAVQIALSNSYFDKLGVPRLGA